MRNFTRVMYDSTTPTVIPDTAEMVGSYANGRYAIPLDEIKGMFPAAQHVRINVNGDPAYGDTLDVEPFDATPAMIARWHAGRSEYHIPNLAVYCNRSNLAAVLAANVPVFLWVATLDGTLFIPQLPPALVRPAAVQAIGANAAGRNVDVSIVFEPSWHPSA